MSTIIFLNPGRDSTKVSAYSRKVLQDIMEASYLTKITITSVVRTVEDQARIMYENIEKYGPEHQKKLYASFGDKVIDEYILLRNKGYSKEQIISGMTAKINSLGPQNVSRHVGDPNKLNVIDIAPSSINISRRSLFESVVNNDPRVSKFLTPPKDPAYHLEIPQP